jgi:hypothetical protein
VTSCRFPYTTLHGIHNFDDGEVLFLGGKIKKKLSDMMHG